MDRALGQRERRARLVRRALGPALGLLLVITLLGLVPRWIEPTLDAHALRTDDVRIDSIVSTLASEGRVVPAFEEVVTSPIESRVTRILLRPGAKVAPGDVILELDPEAAQAEVTGLDQRIALQENAIAKARLQIDQSLVDLQARIRVKELEQTSFEYEVQRNETLVAKGLVTDDVLRKARVDLERTVIELEQLRRSTGNEEKKLNVDLEGLEIEIAILRAQRHESAQRLARAAASATRAGVVTAVLPTEGQAVRVGDELARVADLGSFRVEASFGDVHAQRLTVGLSVRVRIADEQLVGRIGRVLPALENGAVRVEIDLDAPSHPALRQNLRVEVEVVVEEHPRALVVRRGAIVHHQGERYLFVVEGDRALRRQVRIGLSNLATHEVEEGLAAGDRVILSDMSEYARYEEVRIQ